VPLGSEASSTNLQTVRIVTDHAGTFRLPEFSRRP
jgi:hypothetical protein